MAISIRKFRRHIIVVCTNRKAIPREVTHIRFSEANPTAYCVCPGCCLTFEREYQRYCDRCGQRLAWNLFRNGHITIIKGISCTVKGKGDRIQQESPVTAKI